MIVGGVPAVGVEMMLAPPSISGHSLTHEQVIPFLKKLEQGQLREGKGLEWFLCIEQWWCYLLV